MLSVLQVAALSIGRKCFIFPLVLLASTKQATTVQRFSRGGLLGSTSRHLDTMANRNEVKLTNEKVEHVSRELLPEWMKAERTRVIVPLTTKHHSDQAEGTGSTVVYWMQRDVRTADNWALLFAAHLASTFSRGAALHVVYALPPPPPPTSSDRPIPSLADLPMTERHGKFLIGGLKCVHEELKELGVPLHVVMPTAATHVGSAVCDLISSLGCGCRMVVTDFSPLRHCREWIELQAAPLLQTKRVALVQVDAHNVVPVWTASDKREYGARTLRPKINRLYQTFLQKFPKLNEIVPHSKNGESGVTLLPEFKQTLYEDYLKMDASVPEVDWAKPGTAAALEQAQKFFDQGLSKFDKLRNDPNHRNVCSSLSPWINHGHVSFQRLAMAVQKLNKYANGTAAYLEEGMIRRELSDNFVYYEPYKYDSLLSAYEWAQETLRVHASDPREYVYSLSELERGETHDDLWNAAQLQAVRDGKMHGFLRMYWAKKILEWTESPEVALQTGLYLNDKFNIDGRDPNGFVGVGWSIMGIHDMGWKEREVFGKIRYMNYAGCKRK
jgi:deoxyribodipyrimidine photo-lyase